MSLYSELKHRNVFRVAIAYLAAAWLLTEVAGTLFPMFGYGDSPARIVVILLAIGFPLFLIFSWIFEITPDGLKLEKDIKRKESVTPLTGKKLDRFIIVLLVLTLGYFAFDKFVLEPARIVDIVEQTASEARSNAIVKTYADNSIAVLPFVNMSDDANNVYFSDGITEELINLLAQIPELRVTARTSSFNYKGKNVGIDEIAETLRVAHILEGSVRMHDRRMRISAKLIDAHSNTHLWSKSFDRTLDDVFVIQEEIAAAVVNQLRVEILGEVPRVRTANPQAFALFLRARFLNNLNTQESREKAIELYQQALKIEPEYVDAWSDLAVVYRRTGQQQLGLSAIEHALELDPEHAPSLSRASWLAERLDGDLVKAASLMQQAVDSDIHDFVVLQNTASLLWTLGRTSDALLILEHLSSLDPLDPNVYTTMGFMYRALERFDEALSSFRTALILSPNKLHDHLGIGWVLLSGGEPIAALAEMHKERDESQQLTGLAMAYYALGQVADSNAALAELSASYGQTAPYHIALAEAYRGKADQAFEWLERAVEGKDSFLAAIVNEPYFSRLYSDPRWEPFMESIGRTPTQLSRIELTVHLQN